VAGGWWLVAGGWWLVAGGWWLVAGGWWLVAGGWWLVANMLRGLPQQPINHYLQVGLQALAHSNERLTRP
jgi:hypothetical protein